MRCLPAVVIVRWTWHHHPFVVTPREEIVVMGVESLPCLTADLPGIGGVLKQTPDDFVVTEIPLYSPSGEGEHLYVRIEREGWTTGALSDALARLLGISRAAVGVAGLKDRHARVTQTFSLHLPRSAAEHVVARIEGALAVRVTSAAWHTNKLKRGHLLGNHFQIRVVGTAPEALPRAEAIARRIQARGLPNYFGSQRFGSRGDNAARGREILMEGERGRYRLRDLLLSAWQSECFNRWLAQRIEREAFLQVFEGDVAKKHETGGIFTVTDAAEAQARFLAGEISYTGPLFGYKMRPATGKPGEIETHLLSEEGISPQMLRKARLPGSRRAARLLVANLTFRPIPQGLEFSFTLPKGAYATVVLREFMKNEGSKGNLDDED
ncbi:MAG: tRNA pseudouridine(13) synthase TruD [Deltaproteobacteria bacterium]|nr:MAG: tRNA pseudouridine(13) synthase TruD [Deltaproteobacteria bacterium]